MIRAILVDDEKIALDYMESKLNSIENVQVVKTFSDPKLVLQNINELDIQVAFLDIEMPEINGLDLAEQIQKLNNQIQIIFITAFNEYAISAFELYSVDYLLKPVSLKRLIKTIDRIQNNIQSNKLEQNTNNITTGNKLYIKCFGEFSVLYNDHPIHWKTVKVKELFAYFLTHLHEHVNRDIIIESLWPEIEFSKAKILLHTTISHLRKTLDSIGYSDALTYSNQCYTLKMEGFYCDSIEFSKKIAKLHLLTIQEMEEIVQIYTGMYFERNDYEWTESRKQILNQQATQVFQLLIDQFAAINKPFKTIPYLKLLLTYDPYSEDVLRQLMKKHFELGNRGESVKVYREFSKRLQQDLGIIPEKATMELFTFIKHS